jgi:hypothetical protein
MSLHDIEMKGITIFKIFYDIVLGISNMRYFKSQELVLEHGDENQAINCALCNNAIVGLDSYVRELCDRWLHEDHVEGVAK